MKIALVIVRILLGMLFLFASVSFFFNLITPPELTGNTKLFMDGVIATGYLMQLIKATELVCGLAFVSGLFVPLAATVIAPISINIFLYHLFVDTSGLPVAVFVLLANIVIAYGHRDKFKPMLRAK